MAGDEKDSSNSGGGVTIYFLLPHGKTRDTCSENLSDAFDQSEENGLNPTWINTDKTLTQKPTKTVSF